MNALANLTTPLAFSISTLLILWSFGGGNLHDFWQRSFVLAGGLLVLVLATAGFSMPILKNFLEKDFWQQKKISSSMIAGLVLALPFCIGLVVLQFWPSEYFPWIQQYIKEMPSPTWYGFLLISLIVAPILELYWRGLIAPQWGTFTTAFLEGLIWGFAAQHVLFFIAGFASSALIRLLVQRQNGIQGAIVAKAVWTAMVLLTITVI